MPQLISIGSVGVDVVPNATGVYARLAAQMLPDADRVGREAGRLIGERIREGISGAVPNAIQASGVSSAAAATQAGNRAGGAFGRAMRTRLEAALRALPNITIGANTSEADADIQALRVRLESLRNQRIGIDIDAAQARAEAEDIEEQLRRLGAAHPNVQVRVDTAAARAALAEFRAELDRLSRTSASPRIEVDGGFSQRLRAAVEAAQAQLPDINIDANTSQASADLQALRGQLESLRTARVGIDIDAASALARITDVQARLEALAASRATVDVRVDAAAAAAQLAAVQAQVAALDGDTARIDIDVSGAVAGLTRLSTVAASVGPALVPLGAAATFGLGAFTSMLATATFGVGAFAAAAVPSLMGVAKAFQATTAANEAMASAQDKSARTGAAQAIAAQQQALTMAGAQQSLAAAHRNAAQQIADAQERVVDAARQVVDAQDRVKDAEQGVADAREAAARRMDDALDKLISSERARTSAVQDAVRAEEALVDARRAAQEQLEDLNARVAGGAIAERRAVLAVQRAQQDLDKYKRRLANQNSLDAKEAQVAYDEAVQRLQDLQRENKRTAAEAETANAAGVEGSKQVVEAQQGILDAKQRVTNATKAVADAEEDARRTQVDNAKQIAKAQKQVVDAQQAVAKAQDRVADAQRGVVRAQQQGAEQIASAQRQVASAQLAAAAAAASTTEALSAANVAADKQRRALEALTPSQRGVYDAVMRLKDAFKAWGDALSPQILPMVTRAVDGLTQMLPRLTPYVLAAANGIHQLQDRAQDAFEGPFWDRFRVNLIENLPRAIQSMGTVFANVFSGMGGIVNAFLTDTDRVASSMENATGRFRDWGHNLDSNGSFKAFGDYVHDTWPGVKDTLVDVGQALWQLTRALSAVSPSAVLILQGLSNVIEHTPVWVLQTLIDALFAYRVAVVAAAVGTAIYSAAMRLYALGTVGATAGTWSLTTALRALSASNIILLLLTIAGTFVLLMIQSDSFRAKVVGVFKEVGRWGVWLWDNALKPAFDGIAAGAVWLYQNALRPTFDGISLAARILAAIITTLVVAPILIAFNLWSAVALFLWDNALSPVFSSIATTALWLWSNVLSPTIGFITDAIRGWGLIAMWLWDSAISPAFSGIAGAATWLWDKGLRPPLSSAKDAFLSLGQMAQTIYQDWIKPWFDKIGSIVDTTTGGFSTSFDKAKTAIEEVWKGIKKVTAEPINWVVDKVYSDGIKKVWDGIADIVKLPHLPDAPRIEGYATGGIYPGYTPGRDIGLIGVSGGEAIIRPEGTRALGAGFVNGLNAAAISGGVGGAQRFLGNAPFLGGFSFGGIVGGIIDTISDIPGVGQVIDWAKEFARHGAAKALDIALSPVRAIANLLPNSPDWVHMAKNLPLTMMDRLVDKVRGDETSLSTGNGSLLAGLGWARTQAGKPYQWGGSGNPSWDCSGFIAGIEQVIRGNAPSRLFTTFDFQGASAPAGWALNKPSPFMIGVTNANSGHMAGTLLGTNVESRGGDGIVVGPAARGWNAPLFTQHYGWTGTFDSGGPLRPGLTLAYNGTGKTEQVYTNEVNKALLSLAARGAQTVVGGGNGAGLADGTPIRLVLDDGSSFMAHIEREIAGAGVS